MSTKGFFKIRTLLGLAAVIALALGAILAASPALSQSLGVLSGKSRSLEERGERAQPAIHDSEFPGKQKDDLVAPRLDQRFPGKEKDDLVVPSLDRQFPGKEKDDLVVPSLDRQFPGKEKDDLVVPAAQHEPASIWHTPAYQGYTPWRSVPPADPPGEWHTPAYQGYTP